MRLLEVLLPGSSTGLVSTGPQPIFIRVVFLVEAGDAP